uniref:Transmembrane protein 184C n=1 Tax=Lotharella globosa TaxID=91324 RepID=A0A7S3Z2W0_9EUKA
MSRYIYVTIITNVSQIWAMYCLALFYVACKVELGPIRPVGKFMVVKAVVFFTWWQSVMLALLVKMDWIHRNGEFSTEDVVNGTQNLLICLEMLLAAMAHRYTFPVRDFRQLFSNPNSTPSTVKTIFDAVNVTDVFVRDVWDVGTAKAADSSRQVVPAGKKSGDVEMAPLIYRWDGEQQHAPQTRPS